MKAIKRGFAALLAVFAFAGIASAGISVPYPWYWGQDGTNPGSLTVPTDAWVLMKSVQVAPQGNQFCSLCGDCCAALNVHIAYKHPRQSDVHLIVTVNGTILNMGSATVGSDGALNFTAQTNPGTQNPTIAVYALAAGSAITYTQANFPGEYFQLDATNGY